MRILFLVDAFFPDTLGGGSKAVYNQATWLARAGHEVHLVFRRVRPSLLGLEAVEGVIVHRHLAPVRGSRFYRFYPIFSVFGVFAVVRRLLRRQLFDVVNVHHVFPGVGYMLAALDVPMVFNFHAPIRLEINVDARRGKYGVAGCLVDWVGIACSYAEGTILRRADKVLVHSTFMKSLTIKLHRVPDRNILMLPLALDTHKYQPTSNITGVRARLGLPIDRPILLTVRRLEARMGLEVLIQAMQTVVREVPNTLLLIVGSGYLRPRLGQQVQDSGLENHVAFLGQISEDSLPLYYQSADLFVLPTQELEGFGLATIEALSCGTPVVGTPIGATPEILNRVGQGFLSERNDATALADVIIHHLVKGISQQIRQRCREVAIQHYSIEIVMPKLLDALESVCF